MVGNDKIKVLVTGATGFVGRHVINALERRGVPHIAIGGVGHHGVPAGSGGQCAFDLLNPDAAEKLIGLNGTHLIHLAWYAEHKHYWSSPKNFDWAVATLSLVRSFAARGRHVTAIGTCAEYDWSRGLCIEEDTPLESTTIYGQVKAATGSLTRTACAESGVSCCWARLFLPFGDGEHPERLIPSVVDALAGQRPVFAIGNESWRDFLAVEDVADAIVHLTLTEYQGPVNVCSGIPRQIRSVVDEIRQVVRGGEYGFPDSLLNSSNNSRWILGDDSRLRATGWKPIATFSERLAAYVGQRYAIFDQH